MSRGRGKDESVYRYGTVVDEWNKLIINDGRQKTLDKRV